MPSATPIATRREIVKRREAGEAFTRISQDLNVSYDAVRQIYQRYEQTGRLSPAYERCAHTEIRSDKAVYAAAIEMKREHPTWGAPLIWVELAETFEEDQLPSLRTLQRWFRRAGVQKPRPERVPKPPGKRGQTVHEVWAMDAKEQVALADGSYVSWLTVTDEASGAILSVTLFPPEAMDEPGPDASETSASDDHEPVGTPAAHANG